MRRAQVLTVLIGGVALAPAPFAAPAGRRSAVTIDGGSPGCFSNGVLPPFLASWFGEHLGRMGEQSLISGAGTEVYRFTFLPTWGNPLAVRLTLVGNEGLIEAKRLDGEGGFYPGKLVEAESAPLSPGQVKEFKELVAGLGVSKMPVLDATRGFDGSEWILEANVEGEYHLVERWSPHGHADKRGLTAFIDVCEWLFRASPLTGDALNLGHVAISKTPESKR